MYTINELWPYYVGRHDCKRQTAGCCVGLHHNDHAPRLQCWPFVGFIFPFRRTQSVDIFSSRRIKNTPWHVAMPQAKTSLFQNCCRKAASIYLPLSANPKRRHMFVSADQEHTLTRCNATMPWRELSQDFKIYLSVTKVSSDFQISKIHKWNECHRRC